MAEPKRGLGRGLGALIPTETDAPQPDSSVSGAVYLEIPTSDIVPNPRQPRLAFDEEPMAELVDSLRQVGMLQPVVVRRCASGSPTPFELIAGERRWRAAQQAGLPVVPAIVRDTADDDLLREALLENLHRAQLNPLEEAAAYQQLLSDFGCTQEELATRIGRSRPQISNTMRLLKLPPSVQNRVAAGVLSAGHARALLSLDNEAAMEALAARIVAEGLSVRSVEELIILGEADGTTREKKERRRKQRDPKVGDIVDDLTTRSADALDTRCSTTGFATATSRGQLVIECADIEDLRRIVDLID